MKLTWTERQAELRERFAAFGREHLAPGSAERDRTAAFHEQGWKALAAAGFWRVHVPVELGGDGGDLWDHIAAFEGLAHGAGDTGFVLSAAAHAGLLQLLLNYGTDDQRADLLPGLLSGAVGATAATEAAGGSHVAAVSTTATRTGDGYRLTGRKAHITNAPVADVMMILGRVAGLGKHDITLFLVEATQTGVSRGEHEDLVGLRTSPLGPIHLDNVRLPASRVIGTPGDGLKTLYWTLAFDRMLYGIIVAAHLEALIPVALDRALSREAFGAPLAEHQYIQEKIVDMKMAVEASRSLSYTALDALNRREGDFSTLASCAKLLSANGIVRAGLELVQLFGHLGCERGHGIERQLRDAIAFRIAGGTDEMQKKNIFKNLVTARQTVSA
ncbi:acyl-CoA dehydrogenase family protein [Amycolatopsis sp. 195334CR]|uniref:acyl-CoA dehydrogenase family protein n=1 Tax=Amycolatopsis sp. 195334CR TaxID=2814588 RepID=UPI001A8E8A1F|nr:acyl-CoA dehydrogenase family protein [Amycolatopsis sp. 195334CR]MBN6040422.1 acyl-CoA/acyl-ACP dehydrogenase [Amycolatopsis sp. 195334CR]